MQVCHLWDRLLGLEKPSGAWPGDYEVLIRTEGDDVGMEAVVTGITVDHERRKVYIDGGGPCCPAGCWEEEV